MSVVVVVVWRVGVVLAAAVLALLVGMQICDACTFPSGTKMLKQKMQPL